MTTGKAQSTRCEASLAATSRHRSLLCKNAAFIVTAVMAACLLNTARAHEVIGLWTFSGQSGAEIEDGTEFPNAVPGSGLRLKTIRWHGATVHYTGKKPVYLNEVPGGNLFSDGALTNRISSLNSSIRLEGGSATAGCLDKGWLSGCALEIPNFGEVLGSSESWTVEILARATNTSSNAEYKNGNTVSLLGAGSNASSNLRPAICCNPAGGTDGQLRGFTNTTDVLTANFSGWEPNRISGMSVMNDRWRSIVLSYDANTKKYTFRSDYDDFHFEAGTKDSYDVGENSVFRIGGMWGPTFDGDTSGAYYSSETIGRLDVAAVRVSRGFVPVWEGMMPWVDAVPRQLVHYRFDGESGSLAGRIHNAVAPNLDFTTCANLQKASDSVLEDSVVYTNFVCKPYIQTQSNPQKRLENAGSVSSFTNGTWGTLKYYMQNLPAFYADSFTLEMIWWCQNDIYSETFPQMAVSFFRAPDSYNGLVFQYKQCIFYVDAYGTTGMLGGILKTQWNMYAPQRQAWQRVALVYDKPLSRMSVYLNGEKITVFQTGKEGVVPADAMLVKPGQIQAYAQILGVAENWINAFMGVADEFRITRGVLEPEDFLIPRMTGIGGVTILFR